MVFKSKLVSNNFHVWEYTEAEKEFFTSLGFDEHSSGLPNGEKYLSFLGSDVFGLWSKEEMTQIFSAVLEKYGRAPIDAVQLYNN